MRRLFGAVLLLTFSAATASAQDALTRDQRNSDLTELASQYAKNYGPYEWKRDVQQFDLMRLTPWLQRIAHSDDLDFQEALIEYVSSLNDAHDLIAFPTTFSAQLPLSVDIYDGKVLIDGINRTLLPAVQFPFVIGDEVVTFDGRPVMDVIQSFRKYSISANPRSTDRIAAGRLVSRSQQIMPHIVDLGATATIGIRLASTGATNTYTISWIKGGIPVLSQGPLPSPVRGNGRMFLSTDGRDINDGLAAGSSLATASIFKMTDGGLNDDGLPAYMDPIRPLLNASVSKDYFSVLGFGARAPIFALPAGFIDLSGPCATCVARTGEPVFYFAGTFATATGTRVAFLRIPSMSPPSTSLALTQLDRAIALFTASTDALVVDVMRNPGGLVSFVESVSQRLIPNQFNTVGFEIRATGSWLFSFASQLNNARAFGAPPAIIANLETNFNEVLQAFNDNRGRTGPVSLNSTGSLQIPSLATAYAKPILMLTDEFSASGGDMLPAIFQSNRRGPTFGWRTMGAGGSVVQFSGPAFTESIFRITVSLMNRGEIITTPDFPPAPYVENIGVRPDIPFDYMTRGNLVSSGAPFVAAFIQAVENLVHH